MFWTTYVIRVRTMYPPADDVLDDICHPRVDDVHVTPGVVLHEIRQLRQEEGSRHLEQLCIKPTALLVFNIVLNFFMKKSLIGLQMLFYGTYPDNNVFHDHQ